MTNVAEWKFDRGVPSDIGHRTALPLLVICYQLFGQPARQRSLRTGRWAFASFFPPPISVLPAPRHLGLRYAVSGGTVKKKLRILGVDDEPVIGESIAFVLEAPHRKIVVAKDGQEALALAAKEKFDVVITDHRMPRSGGLELVRKLRARKYAGKIVVLSGYLSPENIGTYEELAVDEVVGKPFDSDELREVITSFEDEM
jgi:CheY-like chemotaxis protein